MKRKIDSVDDSTFDYQSSLLSKFYSCDETIEIINIFKNAQNFASQDSDELDRSIELFVAAAENRRELFKELLTELSYNADSGQSRIARPFLEAIRFGDVTLVEVFLRAGASPSLESTLPPWHNGGKTWNLISPMEYACLLDLPEIVSFIVSYGKRCNNKRTRDHVSALHIVTSLATKCLERSVGEFSISRHQFQFAKFVQLIIDAGVSDDDLNENFSNAVKFLTRKVYTRLVRPSMRLSTKVLPAVAETLQILLKAASNAKKISKTSTIVRLNIIVFMNNARRVYYGSMEQVIEFPLMIDALRSDLNCETNPAVADRILCALMESVELVAQLRRTIRRVDENRQNDINKLWEGVTELYRTILLCGGNIVYDSRLSCRWERSSSWLNEHNFSLVLSFASREGDSMPFVRLLLTRMTASQINLLRQNLSSNKSTHVLHYRRFCAPEFARALMSDIETPQSLRHLARVAVIKYMSVKRICDVKMLGLPKVLEDYVQLK